MKLSNKIFYILGIVVFLFIFASFYIFSEDLTFAKSENSCLKCHSVKRLPKVLPNGEKMDLYVDKEGFLNSVHGALSCIYCHSDIDPATHPRPLKISSKLEYTKKVSQSCINCHPEDSLSPIHKNILKEGKVSCAECHGAHYIKSTRELKRISEKCLECHSIKRTPKILPSGEKMDLYIDKEGFKKTIHGKIGCWACHPDIDLSDHPRPMRIESKKAFTNKITADCFRCHPRDVLSKHKGHAKLIEAKEFLCIDCHGYHKNQPIKEWKEKAKYQEYCMSCHKLDLFKTLPSQEKISVKIDLAQLKESVHKNFECIVCHKDFSKKAHPSYDFKTKRDYVINLSKSICQTCHTDDELKKNPAHYAIAKTGSCIDCHSYHNVKSLKVLKGVPENKYCMNCHSLSLTKMMENGEILSVKVDEKQILASAHKDLKCSQCHVGFSIKTHLIRSFKSIADYRSKAQEMCAKCHEKETLEYNNSTHAMAILKGNREAPDCLKCHGYHNVAKITPNLALKYEICIRCHNKENKNFKESIHYKAYEEGKKDAPVCSSCHNAHKVLPTNIAKLNESCIKCHKNVKKSHNKWLYNPPFKLESFVDIHFAGSTCAACHVFGEKAIVLTLITSENKPITLEEISKLTNWNIEEIKSKLDSNKDNIIQKEELFQFLNNVKGKVKARFKGRLDIVNGNDAHKILTKQGAIKDCAFCHNPETQFVGKLEINKEGEKPEKIGLERNAVNSVYAIPNIKDFYVLGLTKINILDILFVIALIAGAGVAGGHIFLRIITTPIRRKRRGG